MASPKPRAGLQLLRNNLNRSSRFSSCTTCRQKASEAVQKPPKKKREAKTSFSSARSRTILNSSRRFSRVTVKVNTRSPQLNASPSSTIILAESKSFHISDFSASNSTYFSKTDALDIDREGEYQEMVEKIHKNGWKKVHIMFDMEEIKKRCLSQDNTSDAEQTENAEPAAPASELSDLDRNLARIRVMLEKKYASEKDGGFSFVCADGAKLRLTPFMMREWCIAIVRFFLLHVFCANKQSSTRERRPCWSPQTRRHLIQHIVVLLPVAIVAASPHTTHPAPQKCRTSLPLLRCFLRLLKLSDQQWNPHGMLPRRLPNPGHPPLKLSAHPTSAATSSMPKNTSESRTRRAMNFHSR